MSFQSFLDQAKSVVSIISNPSQSSVLAGGAVGAFSAEVNNLRQSALKDISQFQGALGGIGGSTSNYVNQLLSPVQSLLRGSSSNPPPTNGQNSNTLWYIVLGGIGFIVLIVVLARK